MSFPQESNDQDEFEVDGFQEPNTKFIQEPNTNVLDSDEDDAVQEPNTKEQ